MRPTMLMWHVECTCFEEVVDNKVWDDAMKEEIRSIEHNNTSELVDLLEVKIPIGLKWVYRVK